MPFLNLIDRFTRCVGAVIDKLQQAIEEDWHEPWLEDAPLDEPLHVCHNREGQLVRAGQSCWRRARLEVLHGGDDAA